MADPVRVQRERRDFGGVTETVGHAHPDDLARAILAVLATDAGRAAIRAGVDARLRDIAAAVLKRRRDATGQKFTAYEAIIGVLADVLDAAPREPAQDGGSAAQPQQGAYPPQAQPRGAAGAATCTCGGRLTLQHRAGCSMAREPAQDEPAAGAGPGPVSLRDCPPGLFLTLDGRCLGLITEYSTETTNGVNRDAYVVASGEYFWGGTCTPEDRAKIMVRPIPYEDAIRALTPPAAPDALLPAWRDVLGERQRQMSVECWTPGHDDEHRRGELALAAAAYCVHGLDGPVSGPDLWPWAYEWWKPKGRRSNLVRATALLLAEIERLDRAEIARRGGA